MRAATMLAQGKAVQRTGGGQSWLTQTQRDGTGLARQAGRRADLPRRRRSSDYGRAPRETYGAILANMERLLETPRLSISRRMKDQHKDPAPLSTGQRRYRGGAAAVCC